MFSTRAGRTALRASRKAYTAPLARTGRRNLTTDPPHVRGRTWKNSAFRWGLAAAGIYYYNTSPVFAEYPQSNLLNPNLDGLDDNREHPTLDQLTASSRNKAQKDASILQSAIEATSEDLAMQEAQKPNPSQAIGAAKPNQSISVAEPAPETEGAAELEDQADQEGAFNPVTGEINWDCPCLGGMAYGPCGEQFKAAFSCFVYSNEEPKGMECIDKFQSMQDCFRAHPEMYKDEIEDNDALDGELAQEKEELQKEIAERRAAVEAQVSSKSAAGKTLDTSGSDPAGVKSPKESSKKQSKSSKASKARSDTSPQPESKTTSHTPAGYSAEKETEHGAASRILPDRRAPSVSADAGFDSDELVPKAAHDARAPEAGATQSRAS